MHKGLEAGCKKPARPTARDGRLMGRPALRANRGENARDRLDPDGQRRRGVPALCGLRPAVTCVLAAGWYNGVPRPLVPVS